MIASLLTHIEQGRRYKSVAVRACAALLVLIVLLITLPPGRLEASVEIQSFRAQGRTTDILVSWKTATEVNNQGFRLLRGVSASGSYEEKGVFPPQCVTDCLLGRSYSFTDSAIVPGQTYFYKLQAIDTGRQFGPISADLPAPAAVPTGTRTGTATATATMRKTATNTPAPSRSPTAAPIPSSMTPTLVPTATKTAIPERTNTPVVTPVVGLEQVVVTPTVTPVTKLARVVATPVARPTLASGGPRAEKTSEPSPSLQRQQQSAPRETQEDVIPMGPTEDDPMFEEAPVSNDRVPDRHWSVVTSLALALVLGIGSVFFAGIGAILLARLMLRS